MVKRTGEWRSPWALVIGFASVIGMGGARAYGAARSQLADLPLAAQATVSATLGRDNVAYHLQPTRAGYHTRACAQGPRAEFTAGGVRVCAAEGACARLRLSGYGYGDAWQPVRAAQPQAAANRVEYRRGDVTEWYVNGPLGIEQGFTLTAAPPRGPDGAPLTVVVALAGGVTAKAEGDGVRLVRGDGRAVARYSGLSAVDATGRELPMRLETRGRQVLLRVNDRGAHYPVVIDPFIQTAKLTASGGAAGDQLGAAVAISGDTVVAGAAGATIRGNVSQGAVYVFQSPSTCVGDCNGNGEVTVDELVTMVNIDLGNEDVSSCTAGDANGDGTITVNEIVAAVNNTLDGCEPALVATPTLTTEETLDRGTSIVRSAGKSSKRAARRGLRRP
jgi:hypothetical protein